MNRRCGRFEIVRAIARGGMAEVLLGVQQGPGGFERRVAIKQVLPEVAEEPGLIDLFVEEARLAARLSHPNICQLIDFGVEDGRHFIAMEYLSGQSLARVFQRALQQGRRIPPELVGYVVALAAEGLAYAHEQQDRDGRPLGLIHRDVSPQNLFITYDGQVKVLDFGIASTRRRLPLTRPGAVRGKINYMSPEQVRGQPLDARTDVFALGIILHEALSGRYLFDGGNDAEVMHKVLDAPIPPLSLEAGIPAELARVAEAALERELDRRLGSARSMAQRIHAALRSLPAPPDAQALAGYMRASFAEELAQEEAGAGDRSSHPLPANASRVTGYRAPTRARITGAIQSQEEPASRLRWIAIAAPVGILLLIALIAYWDLSGPTHVRTPPVVATPIPITTSPRPPAPPAPAHEDQYRPTRPIPVGLVAYWSLDECDSRTVVDDSGHGRDGIKYGVAACTEGHVGRAAVFDGARARIQIPDDPSLHFTTAMTVSAWVKATSAKGGNILNKWYTPDSYGLGFGGGQWGFTVAFSQPSGEVTEGVKAPGVVNRWTHLAGVYDGTTAKLYVDGQLVDSTPTPTPGLMQSNMPVILGSHPDWAAFEGVIDEVALFNVALDAERIRLLATSPERTRCKAGTCGRLLEVEPVRMADEARSGKPAVGWLTLDTRPWTTVYLGERKLGITPLVHLELPAGRHQLRAINKGHGIDRVIELDIPPDHTVDRTIEW